MIVILFTGGTIAMRTEAGGAVPSLNATEILNATRGIDAVTGVETEEWGSFPGPHMTIDRMWALRNRIREYLARDEVTGVVVTHGTDTMVETAHALAAAGLTDKTIVLTGAMVPYAFGSSDGLFNLGSALSFAQVLPAGVYVAMNGTAFLWNAVRKNTQTGVFDSI